MHESSTPSNNLHDRWVAVEVINHTERPVDETLLTSAARRVLKEFGVCRAQIAIAVVTDREITRLHSQYLGQDSPTDVMTFPLSDAEADELCGDIVVSLDTAEREAIARGVQVPGELALYAIHGALHLVGLDDQTDQGAAEMRRWERSVLESLGYRYVFEDSPSSRELA
ncbi:MAG TPA: rRNA maturation RNase YbeY [Pirellulaceae bacterium]|nr:rRNA maturation RNase YbeY [Pirellulaceae bacterium]